MNRDDYEQTMHDFRKYQEQRDEGRSRQFNLITLAELLEQPDPIYNNLVDEMLPAGGTSIIVAKPKIGKSTLAQQLARCIAAGVPFLGREVRKGSVVYLAFEEKSNEVKKSFRLANAKPELPIRFHFGEPPEDQFNALRALIEQEAPGLVIVDTLAHWMGLADFNDYGQVGAALRPLHTLAREATTHIMCVHHAGKGAGRAEGIDSPLGSTALTANVDTIMVLSEHEEDMRVLETRQRYGEHLPKTLLSFDKNTRAFTSEGALQDGRRRELELDIIKALEKGIRTETALRGELKCDKSRLLRALEGLVEAGFVTRTGTGLRGQPFTYYAVTLSDKEAASDDDF